MPSALYFDNPTFFGSFKIASVLIRPSMHGMSSSEHFVPAFYHVAELVAMRPAPGADLHRVQSIRAELVSGCGCDGVLRDVLIYRMIFESIQMPAAASEKPLARILLPRSQTPVGVITSEFRLPGMMPTCCGHRRQFNKCGSKIVTS